MPNALRAVLAASLTLAACDLRFDHPLDGCLQETDAQLCQRLARCGPAVLVDDCRAERSVDCGPCPPTCFDHEPNGDETDAGCGGGCPSRCADTKGCSSGADCASGSCAGATCAPSCAAANGGCDAQATCTNAPAARVCACKSGYRGDGLTCTDIDECQEGTSGCDAHAQCENLPGSRRCTCVAAAGWVGDGARCRQVWTIAGDGKEGAKNSSLGSEAQFNHPRGIAGDATALYVADTDNHLIRKIDLATTATSTFASSLGSWPMDLAVRSGTLYVLIYDPGAVKAVDLGSRQVTQIASGFSYPNRMALASDGKIFVADTGNHRIAQIDGTTVTVLAGSGTAGYAEGVGPEAQFDSPKGVAVAGGVLYVADSGNQRIRAVDLTTRQTSLVAGSGVQGADQGTGAAASFDQPQALAVVGEVLYVSDARALRTVELATTRTSFFTNQIGADGMCVSGSFLFSVGSWGWNRVWKLAAP